MGWLAGSTGAGESPNSASNWSIKSSYFGSTWLRLGNCEVLDVEVRGVVMVGVVLLSVGAVPSVSLLRCVSEPAGWIGGPMGAGVLSNKAGAVEEVLISGLDVDT